MRELTLNLRHLLAFCEIARCGSISAASAQINLSQPAITQGLNKLEKAVGTDLFSRSSSGMFLTLPGELFFARVLRFKEMLNSGSAVIKSSTIKSQASTGGGFIHLITMSQLRAVLAVSETANFTLAAAQMGISQPSLHRLARDLELMTGAVFYKRAARGIELTAAAHDFAKFCRLGMVELRQGIEEVDDWLGIHNGLIAVGSLPLSRSYVLPRAINCLKKSYPRSHVKVLDGSYDGLLSSLLRGEIDFLTGALRPHLVANDFVQQPLFQDRLSIYGGRGHCLNGVLKPTREQLLSCPWVVPREGTPTRAYFDNYFRDDFASLPANIVESSSLVLVRGLLAGDEFLTLISERQMIEELRREMVCKLDVKLSDTPRTIGVTTRKNWKATKIQSDFLKCLQEASD